MKLSSPSRASLALRIALASALFGLVVAAGAIAVGFWTLSRQLDERAATEMQGRRDLLVHILAKVPSVSAVSGAKDSFADLFFGHDDLHLALADPATGRVLAAFSDPALHSVIAIGHAAAASDTVHSWRAEGGARFSGMHGLAKVADGGDVRFYLSVDRHRDGVLLGGFIQATLLALPLLLIVVAVGSGLIARTGLAPLRRFNSLAASIGAQSLSKRISLSGLPGELEDLAREFNNMLERIDEGYRQLEDFSGDLAHEMRTPVATVLGRTQVALSQTRTAAELRGVLEGNVEEFERLSALISDMLFLARADHHVTGVKTEPVDLTLEAQKVADYLSLVAEEKALQLRVVGAAPPIPADRLLAAARHHQPGIQRDSARIRPFDDHHHHRHGRPRNQSFGDQRGGRHSTGQPPARLRTFLPGGSGPFARRGRQRARPGHRPFDCHAAQRAGVGGLRSGANHLHSVVPL